MAIPQNADDSSGIVGMTRSLSLDGGEAMQPGVSSRWFRAARTCRAPMLVAALALVLTCGANRPACAQPASPSPTNPVASAPISPRSKAAPVPQVDLAGVLLFQNDDHPFPPSPLTPESAPCGEGDACGAVHPDGPPCPDHHFFHLEAAWEYGLHLESEDGQFHIHVGGNAQIDATWLIGPHGVFAIPGGGMNGVENASALELRRARLRFEGDIYDQFDYIVEYEFAHAENETSGIQPNSFGNLSTSPVPCNIWMQIRDVPVLGNVRFGNQVKPIGMTNNTYQGFLPFLERADNQDAFYAPFDSGFSVGLSARNWTESERLTWQYGIYGPQIDTFGVSLNKHALGARVTGLPWYEDDGVRLMHLGLGLWGGELVQNEVRARARPVLRNAPGYAVPILVDTGEIPGSRQAIIGPEFALVLGPVTVQAEWAGQFVTDAVASTNQNQGTVFFHGGYVEALYFLTGEHQEYVKREGVFGRVIPNHNYHLKPHDDCWSLGAWQVGVRFSYLDLTDKAIQGGEVYDWTVGLNWFLNPNMKVQLNYILEHRDAPQNVVQGWISGVGVRGAYDF
jgi:phosphate-selective porin OprO/OprP